MNEGVGRFRYASRGKTGIIYVPSDLVKDSTFPFTDQEPILIRIDQEQLTIQKTKKKKD